MKDFAVSNPNNAFMVAEPLLPLRAALIKTELTAEDVEVGLVVAAHVAAAARAALDEQIRLNPAIKAMLPTTEVKVVDGYGQIPHISLTVGLAYHLTAETVEHD